jgi:predicted MFS family arabinose efflux permease
MTDQAGNGFWPMMVAIALASMLLPFSITGAAMALPTMAAHLGASVSSGQWVLNGFNITFAALPLAFGGLADRLGRRRILLSGIAVVGLMSLVVAVAPSMAVVVAARVIQGAGAASVLASGAAVLAHATTGRRRHLAFGSLGASFGSGLAIGPLAAGALVQSGGWRSVFFLLAAISIPALLCGTRAPESRNPDQPAFDVAGLVLFTAGLTCLSSAFVAASTTGWTAAGTLFLLAGAVALIALFAVVELHMAERAMFDVRLFRRPEFVAVICQPFTVSLGFVVLLVYLTIYLQGVAGHSTVASGLLLLPMTAPVLVLPLIASTLAARTSVRMVLTGASVLIVVGALLLMTLRSDGSWLMLALPLLPFGAGVGLAFGVMDNAAVSTVPVSNAGAAAGIFNTMRVTGESVAIAAAAAVLTTLTARDLSRHGVTADYASALAGQAIQGHLDPAHSAALTEGITNAFHTVGLALAALSAVGAILTFFALAPNRAQSRGSGHHTSTTHHRTPTRPHGSR